MAGLSFGLRVKATARYNAPQWGPFSINIVFTVKTHYHRRTNQGLETNLVGRAMERWTLMPKSKVKKPSSKQPRSARDGAAVRFEATKLDALFPVLDAVAFLDLPSVGTISQFAGVDPRTAGKLLKNCVGLAIIEDVGGTGYNLRVPYPAKGDAKEKEAVIREALVRLPLLASYHQFRNLGDASDTALRKAATVQGIEPYDPSNLMPLLDWAKRFNIVDSAPQVEELVNEATREKQERHDTAAAERIVFISHSSKDKPIVRRLTADLTNEGIKVWLDEQSIMVGDSISERISQALAKSDFFIIVISKNSLSSDWVQRELNATIMAELSRRSVHILPVRLDDTEIPTLLIDRQYADLSKSYQDGLKQLVQAIKAKTEGVR
jgi:hypothetical protein